MDDMNDAPGLAWIAAGLLALPFALALAGLDVMTGAAVRGMCAGLRAMRGGA